MPAESTLRRPVGGIPLEVDTFVGRRHELTEIRRLFGNSPLVTLTGPGGVGKTRLSLRAASGMSRTFRDGAFLVELGNLHDESLLVSFIADSLGLREQSEAFDEALLVESLRTQQILLVLDNCEHLVRPTAVLADTLLRSCADLRILATSREPLGIAGEAVLRVGPLDVPDPNQAAQSLSVVESVSLFIERALRVLPDFSLTNENGPDVAQICRQLDGMPLALELAAARLRALSVKDLAARLAQRYQLLTGGSRVAPERHQTLRLCVDWSYEQCSPEERALWRRVSVFTGGFELDAAETICDVDGLLARTPVLDLLTALVDKSILTRSTTTSDDVTRFQLLESLREYGMDRLRDEGELETMQLRQAEWCRRLAVEAIDQLMGPQQIQCLQRLDRELPNLRRALELATHNGDDSDTALEITGSLHMFWISRGLLSEGRHWVELALARPDLQPSHLQLQALFVLVALAGFQGDAEAAGVATARAREVAESLGDVRARAYAASMAGMVALFTGDLDGATDKLAEGAEGHREAGDVNREIEVVIGLGLASALRGDHDASRRSHERVLRITEPRGESWYRAYSLWALGIAELRDGHHAEAQRALEQSLRLRRNMNDLLGSVWCIEGLAMVAAQGNDRERTAVLLGIASAQATAAGTPTATFPDLAVLHKQAEQETRDALGDSRFDKAYFRGEGLAIDAAIAFALGETVAEETPEQTSSWSVLTRRERQVAQLVAEGLTNQAIADKLFISVRTAQGHVENILTKLGYNSRTQIASWVAQFDES